MTTWELRIENRIAVVEIREKQFKCLFFET